MLRSIGCPVLRRHRPYYYSPRRHFDSSSSSTIDTSTTPPTSSRSGSGSGSLRDGFGSEVEVNIMVCRRYRTRCYLDANAGGAGRSQVAHRGIAGMAAATGAEEAPSQVNVAHVRRCRHHQARVGMILSCHRHFHTTARREILPLLGLAAIAVVGRYSYRALRRMDEEWDEYMFDLEKYNEKHGVKGDPSSSSPSASGAGSGSATATFSGHVMGVDVGSSNVRISHLGNTGVGSAGPGPVPEVVEDRQGHRSTPSLVILGEGQHGHHDHADVHGRLARAKLHERKNHASERVLNPQSLLLRGWDEDLASRAYRAAVRPVASNAVEKVMSAGGGGRGRGFDEAVGGGGGGGAAFGPDVLPVFTYPPSFLMPRGTTTSTELSRRDDDSTDEELPINAFRGVTSSLSSPSPPGVAPPLLVPEPVATVEAARFLDLLPPPPGGDDESPVLVLDAGGSYLSTSIAKGGDGEGDVAFHSRCDGAGADVLLDAVVNILCRDFYGSDADKVSDGMALQRMYDAAEGAVAELSAGSGSGTTSRSRVNIPYLSVDTATHQPKHLDVDVSSFALSNEVDSMVASSLSNREDTSPHSSSSSSALSRTLPDPSNLSDVMSSVVTRALEDVGTTPFRLRAVLLVGGGGRSHVFRDAATDGLARLAGTQFVSDRLVVPPGELVEELTVLGAALLGAKEGERGR